MIRLANVALALPIVASFAAAPDSSAAESRPLFYKNVIALCIGIDKYQSLKAPAEFAENDASALGELLKAKYGYTVECLAGKQATRKAILKALASCVQELGPDDVLIVCFAGHGQVINVPENRRVGFLIPYDADLDLNDHRDVAKWRREAIDMQFLTEEVLNVSARKDGPKVNAKHVLLIVDACCSGFMGNRGGLETRGDLQKLLDSPSRMVLSATTDKEKARGSSTVPHGIFTAALLHVLKTTQPQCVTDVLVEVRKRVLPDSSHTMTPTVRRLGDDDGSGELVFLPLSLDPQAVTMAVNDARRMAKLANAALRAPRLFSELGERLRERANRQTTLKDVIDAFESPDYRFADDRAYKAQEWERRVVQLEENAACGDVLAMIAMHYCCAHGLGRDKKDPDGAFRWARLAFDTGHPGGKHVLGRCLLYEIGTAGNERAGLKLIRDAGAAPKPFPISRLQAAIDLCKEKKYAEADKTLKTALEEGVQQAALFLGDCHLGIMPGGNGYLDDITPDPKAAIEVLKPAAEKGNVQAQFLLAHAYAWNREKDGLAKAGEWLKRAAQNGSAAAQSQFARELCGGAFWPVVGDLPLKLGLARDDKRALEFARLAAKQDDPVAFVLLACYHESRREDEKAIEYCDKAIAKNHPSAMVLKSQWFATDKIYRPDRDKQIYWAFRAAPSGDVSAILWLGALYADKAVPKRMLEKKDFSQGKPIYRHYALYYFTRAARRGSPMGLESIQEIARDPTFRSNPIEWDYFKRDFPEMAKAFVELTGFKP